jgi:hypothetical protein
MNYGNRLGRERMTIEALRKYFDSNGNDSLLLQQPYSTRTRIKAHNLKTGIDFFAGTRTIMGVSFTGNFNERKINSFSNIDWMSPQYVIDSSIMTSGLRNVEFKRAGVNFNIRHTFENNAELSADVDVLGFDITGDQFLN